MIKINGNPIDIGNFPDGTLLLKYNSAAKLRENCARITWKYENDCEFLTLIYLVKHLRDHNINDIYLYMPYIPNARMDRVQNAEDVFTLKYFAELLNSLKLTQVNTLDPHSNVSRALINNLSAMDPSPYVLQALDNIKVRRSNLYNPMTMLSKEVYSLTMFYPDEGSTKRYAGMVNLPYAFGIKKRNWETGKIERLDVAGSVDQIPGKDILIVDDICSRGGTFLHSAKKLKELGANDIYLFVSHCENTILEGELLKGDLIKKVYTTDSIFTKSHEKIEVLK